MTDQRTKVRRGEGRLLTPFGELPNHLAADMSLAEQYEWLHRPVSRRGVLGVGVTAVVGSGAAPSLVKAAKTLAQTPVFGRQLAYGPDPRTSMHLSFACASSFSKGVVRATTEGHDTEAPVEVTAVPGVSTRYGRALVTGLRPGSSYSYTIELDGKASGRGGLRTASDGTKPFRFTAFGDQAVTPAAASLVQSVGELRPELHLLVGDLCYADDTGVGGPGDVLISSRWDAWLTQNEPVSSWIPWMCVPGNHEMEPGFGENGYAGFLARVPIGGQSPLTMPVASTFTVGNVAFVGLDSNDVSLELPANRGWTRNGQTAWLETVLRQLRAPGAAVDFIVVYLHSGPYQTSLAHPSEGGVRDAWVPLFDRYGVDLVISGHSHSYERTRPLRGGAVVASGVGTVSSAVGTTYITAGGGGADTAPGFRTDGSSVVQLIGGTRTEAAPWALPATATTKHVVLCVDVDPAPAAASTRMTVRALTGKGNSLDEVVLERSHTPRPITSAAPAAAPSAPPQSGPGAGAWLAAGGAALVAAGGSAAALRAHRHSQLAHPGDDVEGEYSPTQPRRVDSPR